MTELANVGDGLRLADGRVLMPDGSVVDPNAKKQEVIIIDKPSEAAKLVARTRRTLADLPAIPAKMNVVSVVLAYTMYGLSDEEIGIATELTVVQIKRIREDDAYKSASQVVKDAILNSDATDVKEILAAGAVSAARRIVGDVGAKGAGGFAAARDVLDRTGHSAGRSTLDEMMKSGGLTINIVKKDKSDTDISIKLGGE